MNAKPKYKTKQREQLLAYLKSMSGKHVTANDVCKHCKEQNLGVGQSTVYRQLESLVDEGFLNKYIIDVNSPACFEYVDEHSHVDKVECFHCKCEKCGRLIHLQCEELSGIREHLEVEHKFKLNAMRTVFYGICEQCEE